MNITAVKFQAEDCISEKSESEHESDTLIEETKLDKQKVFEVHNS